MRRTMRLYSAIALMVALIATVPAAALPAQDHHDEERQIHVDVRHSAPRVWTVFEGGFLGIHMVDLTPELRSHFGVDEDVGVMISSIVEDSPAATCGLQVGDILTSIDGEPASGSRSVTRTIGGKKGGQPVTLEVFRKGSYLNLEATLEERKRNQFWLNTLGDDGHTSFEFKTDDGENVFVLPGPGVGELKITRERIDEVMGDLQERLASPEFKGRMLEFRSNTAELEARIRELEKRLEELAKELEKIEN